MFKEHNLAVMCFPLGKKWYDTPSNGNSGSVGRQPSQQNIESVMLSMNISYKYCGMHFILGFIAAFLLHVFFSS